MNAINDQAYRRAGREILDGNLEPSCYARAISAAEGDKVKATGLYVELRAQELSRDSEQRGKRDFQRLVQTEFAPRRSRRRKIEIDLLRPAALLLTILLGSISVMSVACGRRGGNLCQADVSWIALVAILVTAGCLAVGIVVHFKFPRIGIHCVLMPFATIVAAGSVYTAQNMIKRHTSVVWESNEEAQVEPLVQLQGP